MASKIDTSGTQAAPVWNTRAVPARGRSDAAPAPRPPAAAIQPAAPSLAPRAAQLAAPALQALIEVQAKLEDRPGRAGEVIAEVVQRLAERFGHPQTPPVQDPPAGPPVTDPPPASDPPPAESPPPVEDPPADVPPVQAQPQPPAPPAGPAPVVDSPLAVAGLLSVLAALHEAPAREVPDTPFSQRAEAAPPATPWINREQAITLRSLGARYQGLAAVAVLQSAQVDAARFQAGLRAYSGAALLALAGRPTA